MHSELIDYEAFDKAFDRVFSNEGGFQNDPKDRGNWTSGVIGSGYLKGTKFGISAMTYPYVDIANLTLNSAREIYKTDWWDRLDMANFNPAIQFQLFDAAVNHGMRRAAKILQQAVGATTDGIIGPKTQAKVNAMDVNDLLMLFLSARLDFMTQIGAWKVYGKGWARRIAHNLKIAARDN